MKKELRYLPFQGGYGNRDRLYDKQRQELEIRANFVRRVQSNPGDTYLDPVLRYHLGLDNPKPEDKA